MRRQREVFTYSDLRIARAELDKAEADFLMRGENPAQYRAAVTAARAMADTIVDSLNRQLAEQRRHRRAVLGSRRKRKKIPPAP